MQKSHHHQQLSRPSKSTNKQSAAKRETSQYAKDMLQDADLARELYERVQKNLTQDFTNIQWWQRPEGEVECLNEPTCGNTNAMFWCHVCGCAYCLECRHSRQACDHDISCYSSELTDFFLPDSIGAKDSTFNIEQLVEDTLYRGAFFGESKSEQSDYRKDQYNELVYAAEQGASVSGLETGGPTLFTALHQNAYWQSMSVQTPPFPEENLRYTSRFVHLLPGPRHCWVRALVTSVSLLCTSAPLR